MANLTESPIYEPGIFQLEKSTPALGGAPVIDSGVPSAGHANAQALQLANRTTYLKQQLEAAGSAVLLSENLANQTDTNKGAQLIGYSSTQTVADALDNSVRVSNYAQVRANSREVLAFSVTNKGVSGVFLYDSSDTTSSDNNSTTLVDTLGRRYKRQIVGNILVSWFMPAKNSAVDDYNNFNAAAILAASLQNGTNKTVAVEVIEPGDYLVSATTTPATWILGAGVEIFNLPGVSPSFVSDTSRLAGKMIRYSGIDQYGVAFFGDTGYNVQKLTGRAYSGAVVGASNKSAGGISGLSYSSARPEYDQGTIGVIAVAVNDVTTISKPVWGFYAEAWRKSGVQGNAIVNESTIYNLGTTYVDNPYIYVDDGPTSPGATYNTWLTSGGVAGAADASFALGIGRIGTSAAFNKGIVVKTNSVSSGEALVLPETYQLAWYKANTQAKDAFANSSTLRQSSTNTNTSIQHVRQGTTTANNSLIYQETFGGNNAGVELNLGSVRVFQRSAISGGFAQSALDWAVRNTAGAEVRVALWPTTFRPDSDAGSATQLNLGDTTFRWNNSYFAVAPTVTSDERDKVEIQLISDIVLDAWSLVEYQQYRIKDSVKSKGKGARWHTGIIAQRVVKAFNDKGLDASEYGIVCHDVWDDIYEETEAVYETVAEKVEDGIQIEPEKNIIITPATKVLKRTAGDKYGIRYEEALVLESALMRRTQQRLEARLKALEDK